MRFNKVNIIFAVFAACMLLGVPQFSYASDYYTETSDDYVYVDEYGRVIDDDYAEEEAVDTSWFDSTAPKREYHIRTKAQLLGFASLVNEKQNAWKENVHEHFRGVTFYLEKDIKLISEWKPVGDDEQVCFEGTFDGKGHTISGIEIDSNDSSVGFFGYLPGKVCNLNLKGSVTSGAGPCGAFAGTIAEAGRITDCTAEVNVKGKSMTGGIAGINDGGQIYGSVNCGSVSGSRNVGGIAGENRGSIEECENYGTVKSSDRGTGTYGTGGIAGRAVSGQKMENCCNSGNIVSHNEATGGIAGFAAADGTSISDCTSSGSIKVINTKENGNEFKSYAGGVVGITASEGVKLSRCSGYGNITGADVTGQITGGNLNGTEIEDARTEHMLSRWQQYLNHNLKTPDLAKAKSMLPLYGNLYRFEKKCGQECRRGYIVSEFLTPAVVRTHSRVTGNIQKPEVQTENQSQLQKRAR